MRRGVTLVELMISMLILGIVCIAWLQIIGIQSARKEARRREAVERLAGMMDAFLYMSSTGRINNRAVSANKYYAADDKHDICEIRFEEVDDTVHPLYNTPSEGAVSSIGYRLRVVNRAGLLGECQLSEDLFGANWGNSKWLVGKLYNRSGGSEAEAGRPFFTLPVCMGL